MEKTFSLNNEEFTTDETEILQNIDNHEYVYVGDVVKVFHRDVVDIDDLIQNAQNRANDESEYGEDYLEGLDKDKLKQLEELVLNFMNNNFEQPRWYKVENVEKISIQNFRDKYCT